MSQKGLNSFQIKVIALILMVFDHIHYIFSGIWDIPMWFTMLGRVSAPLFIFISANGMRYTRHPEKYMLRLWAGSVFMSFGNKLINTYFPLPGGGDCYEQYFFHPVYQLPGNLLYPENTGKKKGRAAVYTLSAPDVRSCCQQHSDSPYNTRTQAYRRFHSYHGLRPITPVLRGEFCICPAWRGLLLLPG